MSFARTRTARVCSTSGPSSASTCRSTTAPTGSRCSATFPSRPIYDFVVKDTDLVVATHGRSFWILDDLTPLHQMRDELLAASRVSAQAARRGSQSSAHRRRVGRDAWRQELPRHQRPERDLLRRGAGDRSCPQAGDRCRRRPRTRRAHHVLPRRGGGRRGKPDHQRWRRQRGRDVLQRDSRGEEGPRRTVVHHRRRGHEQLPVADDVPQRREDGRHRVPQAARRAARQARHVPRRR